MSLAFSKAATSIGRSNREPKGEEEKDEAIRVFLSGYHLFQAQPLLVLGPDESVQRSESEEKTRLRYVLQAPSGNQNIIGLIG